MILIENLLHALYFYKTMIIKLDALTIRDKLTSIFVHFMLKRARIVP